MEEPEDRDPRARRPDRRWPSCDYGQFYALFFLTQTLKVDGASANILIAIALLIGTPFFLFFGSLSDKIGRKPIILAGCLIAALTYFPLFKALAHYANPQLEVATQKAPITVIADPAACSFQFNPVGTSKFTNSCDVAKSALAKAGLNYENVAAPAGATAQIKVGDTVIPAYEGKAADAKAQGAAFDKTLASTLKSAGYPAKADPAQLNWPMTIVILTILVIYVTMVYGPIAAMLVEMFPTRIRYVDVAALSHRQRLVRRLPAGHRVRDRRGEGQHLLGPLVSDRDRAGHVRDRPAVRQGDEGLEHLRAGLMAGAQRGRSAEGLLPGTGSTMKGRHGPPATFRERWKKVLTADRPIDIIQVFGELSSVG